MKKNKKLSLSLVIGVVLLFICYSFVAQNAYSSNSYLKKIFYVEGDGDPNYPPPENIPGYLG